MPTTQIETPTARTMPPPSHAYLSRNVLVLADDADAPLPVEFRLFTAGVNDTTKGPLIFDDEAAKLVMADAEDWGNEFPVDYDHAMLFGGADPAASGKAAGWFRPEVRDGELWAAGVTWTPAAAEMLKDREYRYTSPAIGRDGARVVSLVNVALTNLPATKKLEPLVLSNREPQDLRTLGMGMSFQAVTDALRAALRTRYPAQDGEFGTWVREVFDDTVVFEHEDKLYQIPYTLNGSAVELGETATEVRVTYEPVTQEIEMNELMSKLGLDADATEEQAIEALGKFTAPVVEEAPAEELSEEALSRIAQADEALAKATARADAADAELAKSRDAETLSRHVATAEGFKALSQKPEELGADLMELHTKAPELASRIESLLSRANAALGESKILEEVGVGGSVDEQTGLEKLEKLSKEMVEKTPTLTLAQARTAVQKSHPAIYAEYRASISQSGE